MVRVSEGPPPVVQTAALQLCVHMPSSSGTFSERSLSLSFPLLIRTAGLLGLCPYDLI